MIVCLDANCIIYFIEHHPIWTPKIVAKLAGIRANGDEIAATDLARTECLTKPFQTGDTQLVADYQTFFSSPTVHMPPLTARVCERAAGLRAASKFVLKVPDCLHLAAAIEHGCGLFLTNDAQLIRCTQITVEIIT